VGAVIQVSLEQWRYGELPPLSLRQVMRSAFERMGRIANGSPSTGCVGSEPLEPSHQGKVRGA
jgi:hypothetical protein